MPKGSFVFGVVLNLACFLPGAAAYTPVLIGVGWCFGAVWSLLNLAQSLRARDLGGIVLASVGIVLSFTPGVWLTAQARPA